MSSSDSDNDILDERQEPQDGVARKRRVWSKQEDERLRLLVSYWGDQGGRRSNWDKIASNFENRSAKSCRKRWFHSLDPKLRRGRWNKTEDKILKESYDRLGPAWQRIAQLIPGRTDDQCAKRYNDVVSPDVQDRLRPWEPEEDEKLLGLYAQYGSKWQTIAAALPKRTGLTCRNRWRKLTRPVKPSARSDKSGTSEADGDRPFDEGSGGLNSAGTSAAGSGNGKLNTEPQEGILPFDVPGSNQIAGFPAGADANWLLATGSGAYGQANGPVPQMNPPPPGTQKHLTITIDDPANPSQNLLQQTHYTISDLHLDRILEAAQKNGQHILIHQHIYQLPPQHQLHQEHSQPHGHSHAHQSPALSDPSQGHHIPISSDQHSMGGARLPSTSFSPRLNDGSSSSLLRTVHPPVQPPEQAPPRHGLLTSDVYGKIQSDQQSLAPAPPPPPPDEFLTRPLLFDEQGDSSMLQLDTEEVDFMAFNPS